MSGATTNASGGTHPSGGSAGGAGTTGGVTSSSPSHGSTNSGSGSHNRVQRSISATSSKPRRGSTGAQDSNGGGGAGSGGNPPPSAAPRVNNNIQSNFKRQNTVDTATIKENTPRYSGSRPATATATTSKTQQGKIGTGVLFDFLSLAVIFLELLNLPQKIHSYLSRRVDVTKYFQNQGEYDFKFLWPFQKN